MGEDGAARAIAHRPDVGSSGFEALVDLNESLGREANFGLFESDAVGVGSSAGGDEEIRCFECALAVGVFDVQFDVLAGESFDGADVGVEQDVDTLAVE
jgi:hypothetical protein